MAVSLDHTIVGARDKLKAAHFWAEILGLSEPIVWGHFAIIKVGELSIDFVESDRAIESRHFAFKVSEPEFDEIMRRIEARSITIWADPGKKTVDRINERDGGRGFYFDDPDGHFLEVLTRSYTIK